MSDSESTDNEYESESDVEYLDNIFYDPEEESLTRYNISLCELYNKEIHGNENSTVLYHYLVHSRYKKLDIGIISDICNHINSEYQCLGNQSHNIFRNYREIITNQNYVRPEITECIYLCTGHCVAIKKTFWIKLIQRKWKNILIKRENIIKKRCHPNSLSHREFTGKWPEDCCNYPILRGMLSDII
jgi:hypothetical protein